MPPPTPVINGSLAAFQCRETYSFTPNQGGTYGGKYEGPAAAILAKFNTLLGLGYHVVYECDASPIASVTFDTPNNSGGPGNPPTDPNADYTDNFQVLRNTVQKELLLSDHPIVKNLNTRNLSELKGFILNPADYDIELDGDGTVDLNFATTGSNQPVSHNDAVYLWDLFQSGVRSVEVKQPILRVTRVTNPLYDAPFDLSRVDRVLTTATMISDSGVTSNFAIQLAELAAVFISRATYSGAWLARNDVLLMNYGWLKDAVTSETFGTTKNQYVIEYKFGLYDWALYGSPL